MLLLFALMAYSLGRALVPKGRSKRENGLGAAEVEAALLVQRQQQQPAYAQHPRRPGPALPLRHRAAGHHLHRHRRGFQYPVGDRRFVSVPPTHVAPAMASVLIDGAWFRGGWCSGGCGCTSSAAAAL